MALKLFIPPAVEPVTLDEAKAHLRIDGTEEDVMIAGLIQAAREYCENFQNRAYITQTWQLWLDNWPDGGEIRIPRPPLRSVTHVKYYDTNDVECTFSATDYIVDTNSEPGQIVLGYRKIWPSVTLRPANAIVVEYVAGGAGIVDVPQRVKQAILLLVAHWYENREGVTTVSISKELEFTVSALLWQDRVVPV